MSDARGGMRTAYFAVLLIGVISLQMSVAEHRRRSLFEVARYLDQVLYTYHRLFTETNFGQKADSVEPSEVTSGIGSPALRSFPRIEALVVNARPSEIKLKTQRTRIVYDEQIMPGCGVEISQLATPTQGSQEAEVSIYHGRYPYSWVMWSRGNFLVGNLILINFLRCPADKTHPSPVILGQAPGGSAFFAFNQATLRELGIPSSRESSDLEAVSEQALASRLRFLAAQETGTYLPAIPESTELAVQTLLGLSVKDQDLFGVSFSAGQAAVILPLLALGCSILFWHSALFSKPLDRTEVPLLRAASSNNLCSSSSFPYLGIPISHFYFCSTGGGACIYQQ
jgi:hypothetical protein